MAMGWPKDGCGVAMGWLRGGHGAVCCPPCASPSPFLFQATSRLLRCVRVCLGEPRETPQPRRRRAQRTAFILPYLLGVAFRETLWPAPGRTRADPPRGCWPIASPTRPPPPASCPPSPCCRGAGSDETSGKEQTPKAKKKTNTNTNQPNPNRYRRKPARCQPRRRHRAHPRWQPCAPPRPRAHRALPGAPLLGRETTF